MAYRDALANVNATVQTSNNIQRMQFPWALVITIVLLVLLIMWLYKKVKDSPLGQTISAVGNLVTAPVAAAQNTATAARAERDTGQNSDLSQAQIDAMVDVLLDQVDQTVTVDGKWVHKGVTDTLLSITSAADWTRLCAAFAARDRHGCNSWWHAKTYSLPASLTYHLPESELMPIREHLKSKNVLAPGF